jgi:hypothetical protein
MIDDSDKPASGAEEPKSPKKKAEDNPWCLLATLYGVSGNPSDKRKNRVAWSRYYAKELDAETRARLIEEKRHSAEELTPFSPGELKDIETAFAERRKELLFSP